MLMAMCTKDIHKKKGIKKIVMPLCLTSDSDFNSTPNCSVTKYGFIVTNM